MAHCDPSPRLTYCEKHKWALDPAETSLSFSDSICTDNNGSEYWLFGKSVFIFVPIPSCTLNTPFPLFSCSKKVRPWSCKKNPPFSSFPLSLLGHQTLRFTTLELLQDPKLWSLNHMRQAWTSLNVAQRITLSGFLDGLEERFTLAGVPETASKLSRITVPCYFSAELKCATSSITGRQSIGCKRRAYMYDCRNG